MITVRKSEERGHVNHGWLDTYHTFSFDTYHDPNHMRFRTLRVINEDRVEPAQGFGKHSHRDMEIITYILKGALAHQDSMGNTSAIRPGEVQRMSAGTGVTHSEFNASPKEPVHLLQIWIFPERKGLSPEYEQRAFDAEGKKNRLRLVVSPAGDQGSIRIHQDARVYDCLLEGGQSLTHNLSPERGGWVQVIRGELKLGDRILKAGDGASVEQEPQLRFSTNLGSEFLLFDLGAEGRT